MTLKGRTALVFCASCSGEGWGNAICVADGRICLSVDAGLSCRAA